jgi:hypothetical protein
MHYAGRLINWVLRDVVIRAVLREWGSVPRGTSFGAIGRWLATMRAPSRAGGGSQGPRGTSLFSDVLAEVCCDLFE